MLPRISIFPVAWVRLQTKFSQKPDIRRPYKYLFVAGIEPATCSIQIKSGVHKNNIMNKSYILFIFLHSPSQSKSC